MEKTPQHRMPIQDIHSYRIFHKLETGEFALVGTRDDLNQAKQLVESLIELWPAEYMIRATRD